MTQPRGLRGGKKPLSPREVKFVDALLKGNTKAGAARAAGSTEATARTSAYAMINRPRVQAALEEARKEVQKKLAYGLEAAMAEAEAAIAFARETENANAYVKAVELRSKLNGLLVDKVDLRAVAGFKVMIEGVDWGQAVLPAPALLPVLEDEDDVDPFS